MRNGSQEGQSNIRERVKEAAMVIRSVWGIGMRLFGKDWKEDMAI